MTHNREKFKEFLQSDVTDVEKVTLNKTTAAIEAKPVIKVLTHLRTFAGKTVVCGDEIVFQWLTLRRFL